MTQFTYTITAPMGLHARPAGALVELVKGLSSAVSLVKGTRRSPADRLMSLMLMELRQGDTVTVTAEGPQEAEDILLLEEFFRSNL